jgi:5-methylcytosine-specific restriction protein A
MHSARVEAQRWEGKAGVYRGDNGAWVRLRLMVLAEEPLCRECLKLGMVEPASEVDHVISVRQAPELRLVRSNLQSLCASCHSKKTAKEMGWSQ